MNSLLFDKMSDIVKKRYNYNEDLFSIVYQFYYYMLLKNLDEKLHLSIREQELLNGIYHLNPVERQKRDYFQSFSYLNFFYIRSPLRIDRLFSKEIQMFNGISSLDEIRWDKKKFYNDTYFRIVIEGDAKNKRINYGPYYSPEYYVPVNTIVLGVRFDPQYEKGTRDNPDWLEHFINQKVFLKKIISDINQEAKNMGLVLKVIEYNQATVNYDVNSFHNVI